MKRDTIKILKIFTVLLFLEFILSGYGNPPKAPSDLNFSNVTKNSVTLKWQDNSDDESGFKIFRDGRVVAIVEANTTQYTDSNLQPNRKYIYKIKATNDVKLIYGKIKSYIPDLDLNDKESVYKDIKGSSFIDVNDTNSLKTAINNAKPYTTINLKDGIYKNVMITIPKNLHHLTIRAVNRHKAVIIPAGWDQNSAFLLSLCFKESECPHHINFIGLDVHGEGNSTNPYNAKIVDPDTLKEKNATIEGFEFIKAPSGGKYNPSYIYMRDIKAYSLILAIYSGVHSHDWTLDNSTIYDSNLSHSWYMLGWHHSVINSYFKNGSSDIVNIRGYYPKGEEYFDDNNYTKSCDINVFVKDREALGLTTNLLPKNEWTHFISHNIFDRWKFNNQQRHQENSHVTIGYGIYGNNMCTDERVYLPPQNIEISNNLFTNIDEHKEIFLHAIKIDGREGIEDRDNLESVNGIEIFSNKFIKSKDYEQFIVTDSEKTRDSEAYNDLLKNAKKSNEIILNEIDGG
jgi:hypothetical protein